MRNMGVVYYFDIRNKPSHRRFGRKKKTREGMKLLTSISKLGTRTTDLEPFRSFRGT